MMFVCKYLILISIIVYNFHWISSCGCYGSKSCTVNGTRCDHQSNDSCLCDCCPACNTCEQFLELNCLADRYLKHFGLSTNQSDIIARINKPLIPNYIIDQHTGEIVRYLWNPCLRRLLPNGINLIDNSYRGYELVGTPTEKLEKTLFEILFKGPVNQIILVNFTITII
jgi:hypothetical protein